MNGFEHFSEIFDFSGTYLREQHCSNGHINDTSRVVYQENGKEVSYIHQRINHNVFKNIPAVMENIVHVTRYQRQKLESAGCADIDRRVLTLIYTRDGKDFFRDDDGMYWRTFRFIENARGYEVANANNQLFEAGKAFGSFQQQLSDLPHELHETIPDFHHTPNRFKAFQRALEEDSMNRAADARELIDYTLANQEITGKIVALLDSGELPVRVTHNDTKLNNVLIDNDTGEGICVVDLDTVMSGTILYDFGDLVRAATCNLPEDARDVSGVCVDMSAFEAILRGYLNSASGFLSDKELELLPFSAQLISLELGMRFLTDFLSGDSYFKIHRPGQNLDRCNRQYAMAKSIQSNLARMQDLVWELAP